MNEWTIVTVIIALAGFLIAVIKPVINLTSSITKLTAIVDTLERGLASLTTKNSEADKRLDGHDIKLENHEQRIKAVEKVR